MAKNDNVFLFRFTRGVAVHLFALVVALTVSGSLKADVALPPSTTTAAQTSIMQTPNGSPVVINGHQWRGHTPISVGSDGRWKVSAQPTKNQFGNVQNGVATKTNPVRITDPYGNVSRTTVTTQTQLPQSSTLSKMGTGLMGGIIAGNLLNSPHAKTAAGELAKGNYGTAAANAVAAFDVFGIGGGIYGLINEYQEVKASIAPELQKAAAAKAQAAEQKYQTYANSETARQQAIADAKNNGGSMYALYMTTSSNDERQYLGVFAPKALGIAMFIYDSKTGDYFTQTHGDKSLSAYAPKSIAVTKNGGTPWVHLGWQQVSTNEIKQMSIFGPTQQEMLNDFLLNQTEIESVIAQTLTQMLQSQQQNTAAIKDLVNMLWANNQLNASNTQTQVVGTTAENTVLSAPYTPAGTEQAQQTQHVINQNGSITTSYIPRPDLGANSSLAPTRTKVGTATSGKIKLDIDIDGGSGEQQSQQKEICNEATADKLLCLDAGSDDYEDLEIPTEEIELDFEKKSYFKEHGECPAPVKFSFLGEHEISYEPFCDIARGLRPIVELLGVLTAMGIAYGAVREL